MNLFDIFESNEQELDEDLRKWFKDKWVRFGPDGEIRGDCARGDDSEGKPKCLPQSKAQSLGKKGRASAAARKRREDPNPERSGKAINVNTKKKSNEGVAEGLVGDVVVHNYTKIPIDLEPGQAQIAGWGPNDEPLYRVKGQDGKEVKTWSKRRMLTIAKEQGVAEAINPDITNPAFSHQQQIGDYLYVARYWSKGLKITAYHGNKKIGRADLMYHSGWDEPSENPKYGNPNKFWLESEMTEVHPKYQRQGIMGTMYAYARMLGNTIKASDLQSDEAQAAWKSWRQSGDKEHLTRMKAEAFGPLPNPKEDKPLKIQLGRHTVEIKRVGQDNDHISFAWHDSQNQDHYEEVPVGELGSYDDLIDRIKDEIRYQERQYTDQGVAEGLEKFLPNDVKIAINFNSKDPIAGLGKIWEIVQDGKIRFYLSNGHRDALNKLLSKPIASKEDWNLLKKQMKNVLVRQQGVAEGVNDTVYPNATVIKSKNGRPVGEIYQDGNSWGCFHYRADRGYDFIDSREDAIEALKDLHQETGRSRPDYTIKGVAEEQLDEKCWDTHKQVGMKKKGNRMVPNCVPKESIEEMADKTNPDAVRRIQQLLNKKFDANLDIDGILGPLTLKSIKKFLPKSTEKQAPNPEKTTAVQGSEVKEEKCPHCGGEMVSEELINEKKDSCYYKVKSRYKVWPSAYASGALVKCRKKGAKNWGNKSEDVAEGLNEMDKTQTPPGRDGDIDWTKKQIHLGPEHTMKAKDVAKHALKILNKTMKKSHADTPKKKGVAEDQLDEKWSQKYKDSINCSNPKGFSQKAHCAGEKKNEDIAEGKEYYIVTGTDSVSLRRDFNMAKDRNGWYLREGATPKQKLEAFRAFGSPKLKEFNLAAFSGGTQTKGEDNVISPVGSQTRAQYKK